METTMSARWGVPAFGVLMGVAMFAASAIGGQPALGLGMLAVMTLYSAFLVVVGNRSETAALLRGQPADERLSRFDVLATAVAGFVAIVVAIGGFLWEISHGQSGSAFALVAAAAGIAYLAALLWFRWRG